jgi:hypothetical protein
MTLVTVTVTSHGFIRSSPCLIDVTVPSTTNLSLGAAAVACRVANSKAVTTTVATKHGTRRGFDVVIVRLGGATRRR